MLRKRGLVNSRRYLLIAIWMQIHYLLFSSQIRVSELSYVHFCDPTRIPMEQKLTSGHSASLRGSSMQTAHRPWEEMHSLQSQSETNGME